MVFINVMCQLSTQLQVNSYSTLILSGKPFLHHCEHNRQRIVQLLHWLHNYTMLQRTQITVNTNSENCPTSALVAKLYSA